MAEDERPSAGPISRSARERALTSLLQQHPDALVSAINPDGLFVELPPDVELAGQRVATGVSALSHVDAASRKAIIETWEVVLAAGGSSVPVVLTNGAEARYHFLDLRHRYGVLLGILVPNGEAALEGFTGRPPVLPKTGRTDKDGLAMIIAVDERMCLMLGFEADDLVGTRSLDLIHPDDQDRAIDAWLEMLAVPGGTSRLRVRHLRGDGSFQWLELTNTNRLDDEGRVVTELVDISDEMEALDALRQREQLLTRLAEALPSGVLHFDADLRVLYANERLAQLVGVDPAPTVDEQLATVTTADREELAAVLRAAVGRCRDGDLEVQLQRPGDPALRRCAIAVRALVGPKGEAEGGVLSVNDVTEAWRLRAELERRATLDGLTGCLNRPAVLSALELSLQGATAKRTGTAVVFLDLDGFKEVNDTFGHQIGDELLRATADRLRSAMRAGDMIGRLGGDEFVVVLPDVRDEAEAITVAQRLGETLWQPIDVVSGMPVRVRSSAGVAWTHCDDGTDADALIAAADRAMYEAKRVGTGEVIATRA
jgi:diguanylate cyclase (GGDEF)-like protein/PAS domain S-box-containing protein